MYSKVVAILILLLLLMGSAVTAQNTENTVNVLISNPNPFPGELITYTVSYSTTDDLSGVQVQLPDFFGFAQRPGPVRSTVESPSGIPINVITQDVILYATRISELTITPATISIPETPFQAGSTFESNTITVVVKSLPEGAPDSFTGVVGQFDLDVALEKTVVQANELNSLILTITGTGNIEQIISPLPDFPESWQVFDRAPIYDSLSQQIQSKTFTYQFFPDRAGNLSIPVVSFSYFDPNAMAYNTLVGPELTFAVEGEFANNTNTSETSTSNNIAFKPMTSVPISPFPSIGYWILWLITPVIAVLAWLMGRLFRGSSDSAKPLKQSQAFQRATNTLMQAREKDPTQAYQLVETTIMQYIGQTYRKDVTADTLEQTISDLSPKLQQRILYCMKQAQSGQYAPVSTKDANVLIQRTLDTLNLIEQGK